MPFALSGGTAIGTGRGDRLSPALATGSFHWVLAVAEFGLSTPGVYRELDRRRDAGLEPSWRDHGHGDGAALDSPTVDAAVLQALRAGDPAGSPTRCTTTSSPRRCRSPPASAASSSSARTTARSRA